LADALQDGIEAHPLTAGEGVGRVAPDAAKRASRQANEDAGETRVARLALDRPVDLGHAEGAARVGPRARPSAVNPVRFLFRRSHGLARVFPRGPRAVPSARRGPRSEDLSLRSLDGSSTRAAPLRFAERSAAGGSKGLGFVSPMSDRRVERFWMSS